LGSPNQSRRFTPAWIRLVNAVGKRVFRFLSGQQVLL